MRPLLSRPKSSWGPGREGGPGTPYCLLSLPSTPSWLLQDPASQLRTANRSFVNAVNKYFDHLIPRVAPLQVKTDGCSPGSSAARPRPSRLVSAEKGADSPPRELQTPAAPCPF